MCLSGIPKEKVSDDAPIELTVHARAQWTFPRPTFARDLNPPLGPNNMLFSTILPPVVHQAVVNNCNNHQIPNDVHVNASGDAHLQPNNVDDDGSDEKWLSQVEITTHSGPHRRLWMGPQFTFKVFNPS
jgi:breast carcinoma-amplified sequence 3